MEDTPIILKHYSVNLSVDTMDSSDDSSILSEEELELELELEQPSKLQNEGPALEEPSDLQNNKPQPSKTVRKREIDATEFERFQLCTHSQSHPKETQRQLSQWFYTTFKKEINQSTVSRM